MLKVTDRHEVVLAQLLVRDAARRLGAASHVAEELAIIASELATNLIRHAGGGMISVQERVGPRQVGRTLMISAEDSAACTPPLVFALERHHTQPRAGSGYGVDAIRRLADLVRLERRENGKRITAQRCLCHGVHHSHCKRMLSSDGFSRDQPSIVIFTGLPVMRSMAKPT